MNEDNLQTENESNIDLAVYLKILWKRRRLIAAIVAICFVTTTVAVFLMKKTYQASAVIAPVDNSKLPNIGGLGSLASSFSGILGGSSNSEEINSLLNSNILREEVIIKYNLLHVFFEDRWDAEKKTWHEPTAFQTFYYSTILGVEEEKLKQPGVWDGLRFLEKKLKIKKDTKENTLTITFEYQDPVITARIVDHFIDGLNDHMSGEAIRVAQANRKYLEAELEKTFDPLLQQKIYAMIAQQIETATLAQAKENYAFKVLDPPMVPDKKIKPKKLLLMALSVFVSFFFAIFIAIFLENKEELRRKYFSFFRDNN